jgi:hypothetical protein
MRKLLSIAAFLFISITSYGQLKPPQQTDTLIIKSVQYNYSEILEENWPCQYILKSATHFQFGEQQFRIYHVEKSFDNVIYFFLDTDRIEDRCLEYQEKHNTITISYSGYEFVCALKREALFPDNTFPDRAGAANVRLAGRTVIGAMPHPTYDAQVSGKVVVKIKINRDGTVVDAQPGEAGTTLTDKKAWNAATKAALKIQFNAASDAPEFQYGTVTYIFK